MTYARIAGIAYHLPDATRTNEDIEARFPEWSAEKIASKTGISVRRIAAESETATDLAVKASQNLFRDFEVDPQTIDFVILCTQGPDYFLPASACVLQNAVGIPTTAGAIDINQGCSGYIYSLAVAKGLVESGTARRVLIATADTYSKYIDPADKSMMTLFGDGAAATLIERTSEPAPGNVSWIGPFVLGTDGSGADKLIVRDGGMRNPAAGGLPTIQMDGTSIFSFSLTTVPNMVRQLLELIECSVADVDRYVFHQANFYMIETIRRQIKIPQDKFVIDMAEFGNTVSSTIPIALANAMRRRCDTARPESNVLAGFGVGLSWGTTVVYL